MDSNWDSASFSAGTLECLLCKESLEYVNGDRSDFMDHINSVHQAKIHQNLILAITFLDNKTLNSIISQFEEQTKSVGEKIADIFGIDESNEGLLIDSDEDIVEIIEEKEPEEEAIESEVNLDEGNGKNELQYEDVIASSEYFKNNPKQITTKCNIDLHSGDVFPLVDPNLPSGWKVRDHTKPDGKQEKHFLAPDGRVIKSKRAVIEYMKIMEEFSVESIISVESSPPVFGDLWNHLSSNESTPKNEVKQKDKKRKKAQRYSEEVLEVKKPRRSGVGSECPVCHKFVSMPRQHMEDMHSPPGHFPCRGCDKVFTSKNKESSHYSRHCNPNRVKK